MTRETKVGLVVVGSFLCLVGVVVSQKLRPVPEAAAPDAKDEKLVHSTPKKDRTPANDTKPKVLPASLLEASDSKTPPPAPAPTPPQNPDPLFNLPGIPPEPKQQAQNTLNNVAQQGQGPVDQVNQQSKEILDKINQQNQQTAKNLFNQGQAPIAAPQGNSPFALPPPLALNSNPPAPAPIKPTDLPPSVPAPANPTELQNPSTLPPLAPLPPLQGLPGLPGIEEKKGDGLPPLGPVPIAQVEKKDPPPIAPLPGFGLPEEKKGGLQPLPPPLPGIEPAPLAPLPGLNPPMPEPKNALPPIQNQNPVPLAPPIPITTRNDLPPINTAPMQGVQPIPPGNDPIQRIGTNPGSPVTINMDPSRIPVIGGQTDRTLTPQNFTKPAGQVTSQQTKIETVKQGGESWEALSQGFYGTDRYAQALRSYNRDQTPLMSGLGNQFAGATQFLSPGQRVIIPSTNDLETGYRNLINPPANQQPPLPQQQPAPRPGGGLLGQPTPLTPVGGSSGAGTQPTADRVTMYRVPANGKMIQEIAREQLGDRTLWTEIYRLNPNYPPQQPIPGDVTIRIPAR